MLRTSWASPPSLYQVFNLLNAAVASSSASLNRFTNQARSLIVGDHPGQFAGVSAEPFRHHVGRPSGWRSRWAVALFGAGRQVRQPPPSGSRSKRPDEYKPASGHGRIGTELSFFEHQMICSIFYKKPPKSSSMVKLATLRGSQSRSTNPGRMIVKLKTANRQSRAFLELAVARALAQRQQAAGIATERGCTASSSRHLRVARIFARLGHEWSCPAMRWPDGRPSPTANGRSTGRQWQQGGWSSDYRHAKESLYLPPAQQLQIL